MTCGDMIYSGHTMLMTLNVLLYLHYCRPNPRENPWFKTFENLFCFFFCALMIIIYVLAVSAIIITKLHYTIDVIVAQLVVFGAFTIYFWAAETKKLRERNAFLSWMETEEIQRIDEEVFRETLCSQDKIF